MTDIGHVSLVTHYEWVLFVYHVFCCFFVSLSSFSITLYGTEYMYAVLCTK